MNLGSVIRAMRRPFVVGADWDMTPEVVEEAQLPLTLDARLACSRAATCVTHKAAREIDFFCVSQDAAARSVRRCDRFA
eukprot:5297818-Pyramimonas_sp.AAC.1